MNNNIVPDNYINRPLEDTLLSYIDDKEILVLRGPRQSGKSTMLAYIADKLTKKHGDSCVFVRTMEDELELNSFEKNPKDYIEFFLDKEKKIYLFLDEIQYVKKAGKILKLIFDLYQDRIKLIVTGSSTLDLRRLGEFLVGRALFFELYPFDFASYLKVNDGLLYQEYVRKKITLQNLKNNKSGKISELNKNLKSFLSYGGYPRIVMESDEEKKKVLLKNIYSTYIEKDVIKIYGLKYKDKIIRVLQYLATNIGQIINYNDIGQFANVSFNNLKEILDILEQSYVIKAIYPYHKNLITELKKSPKYYFYDLGMRNVLLNKYEFSDLELGPILENYVFLVLKEKKLNFWRTTSKAEIDFINIDPFVPIEVKKQAKISRSVYSFISEYEPEHVLIASYEGEVKDGKNTSKIFSVPISLM